VAGWINPILTGVAALAIIGIDSPEDARAIVAEVLLINLRLEVVEKYGILGIFVSLNRDYYVHLA
jgi:hypothetical protein